MTIESGMAVIMPAFQESNAIVKVFKQVESLGLSKIKLYVVIDRFDDPTYDAILLNLDRFSLPITVLCQAPSTGPASAIRYGIQNTLEEFLVLMTADDSDDATDLRIMQSSLLGGSDLVCASRYARGGKHKGGPIFKHLLSRLAAQFIYRFSGTKVSDPTNLYKGFNRRILDNYILESKTGFTIGLELVVIAKKQKTLITEFPTSWTERTSGTSNFKILKWLPQYFFWFLRVFK